MSREAFRSPEHLFSQCGAYIVEKIDIKSKSKSIKSPQHAKGKQIIIKQNKIMNISYGLFELELELENDLLV